MWPNILGAILQLVPYAIVGVQHLMPGSSGEEKKQAVVQLAGTALAAAAAVTSKAAPAVQAIAPTIEPVVQSVFDLIMHNENTAQAMVVHPDNTVSLPPNAASQAVAQIPVAPPLNNTAQPVDTQTGTK
jgi:hypothetical protein